MISNITAGNVTQIDEVIKAGLLGPLIDVMLKVGENRDTIDNKLYYFSFYYCTAGMR